VLNSGLEAVVLRYGGFYGPGSSLEPGGAHAELIRKRRFPIADRGTGIWSFVHLDDAATATVAAIEGSATGVFNIVGDDSAPIAEWLPALARELGAPPPRRLPGWLVRLAGGAQAYSMMTRTRGASNAKAKRVLGWQPEHTLVGSVRREV
jgi:nucleoside-diphosphate-sugar epimerase